jgi:predicted TIM-barrel fold metal-dependent hydrolase
MSIDYKIIDIHVHITPWEMLNSSAMSAIKSTQSDYNKLHQLSTEPDKLVEYMDKHNIDRIGLINYLSPDIMGYTEAVNDFSSHFASYYPERFIPFGGVDPRLVSDMFDYMDHLLDKLKIKAIKIHPPHQLFNVNDYLFKSEFKSLVKVYEKCIEYDVPIMVHTGTSVFKRARNRFADPMPIDDVAVDFPKLKIIIAHGGRPLYMETVFFLVRRHSNVYFDISSIPPKLLLQYFPWLERVQDKALFGSDWPGPGVKDISDNIQQFLSLNLPVETNKKILRENAVKLFDLS